METERNEKRVQELMDLLSKRQREMMVWGAISLGLLSFLVIGVSLIISWTGEFDFNDCWPFFLLLLFDLPLLFATWKCYQRYSQIKRKIARLSKEQTPSGDYARNRDLLKKERDAKFAVILVPALAVFCLINHYPAIILVLAAAGFAINLLRLKKLSAQIRQSNISEKERAAFTEDYRKNNKTKGTIAAIILVILMIIATAVSGGGSSKSSSSKPWKELGVSEREYMEVYNKIKYGE